ncbi:radical SAM domain-containing protein [Cryptosporidium muris RN66]|uniref:Radical SAM domain-containing protein n=1 Tax=Cryptosporidium muris (strain RN66) TaxID=441375 RepID=B6AEB0_CRYMR|nr:radical SAM domain-containing protein [Cryptosporidium muris RN66]EEA06856.1 radical SAM domain-containing protein [Cryptosporidium muris RN66]|eukprot:XP_002141205.1 radical SAM domain-containing protein [Cryptosporidium muris RN66]
MENKRRYRFKQQPIFDSSSFLKVFRELKVSESHAYRVWRYLIQKNVKEFSDIPDIPKRILEEIQLNFKLLTSNIVQSHTTDDGNTTKLIIRLQDGHEIETVIMRYDRCNDVAKKSENKNLDTLEVPNLPIYRRVSLCVSSQIGCRIGCTFCATGTLGLGGSLVTGEIIEQVYHAINILNEPVKNVVFMGMGEPLENYNEVVDAIKILLDTRLYGLSPSKISISTVGIPSGIVNMADDLPGVGLCLSLHAPDQVLREQIVPIAKMYKISELIRSTDIFIAKSILNKFIKKITDQRNNRTEIKIDNLESTIISPKWFNSHSTVMIEYILIKDVNDSINHAKALANLLNNTYTDKNDINMIFERCIQSERLEKKVAKSFQKAFLDNYKRSNFIFVNILPYSETNATPKYATPSEGKVRTFCRILNNYGIVVTVRRKMGQDIGGACGQLAFKGKIKEIQDDDEYSDDNKSDNYNKSYFSIYKSLYSIFKPKPALFNLANKYIILINISIGSLIFTTGIIGLSMYYRRKKSTTP